MYGNVENKEKKSDRVNSFTLQKQNKRRPSFQIMDNRPEAIVQMEQLIQFRLPKRTVAGSLLDSKITGEFTENGYDISTEAPPDQQAHTEGFRRLLRRQMHEIGLREDAERIQKEIWDDVKKHCYFEQSIEGILAHGSYSDLENLAEAITTVIKEAQLGTPEDYRVAPKNSTEVNNISSLVASVSILFDKVMANSAILGEVFGKSYISEATTKLFNGKSWMHYLHRKDKIITDRSGFSKEVDLGGMSAAECDIFLPSAVIDSPGTFGSKTTLLHEAMHAGNKDVLDNGGYIGSPCFKIQPAAIKLANAAHYEVLAMKNYFPEDPRCSGVFEEPGKIGVSGEVVPEPTQTEQVLRDISEIFRKAWTMGLWLYQPFLDVYKVPERWSEPSYTGVFYSQFLPFWSKVTCLTLHERTPDPTSSDQAKAPVSQIDLALLESFIKWMATAMNWLPQKETQAWTIESVYPEKDNWRYVFRPEEEKKAFLKYMVEWLNISGDTSHDLKAVSWLSSQFGYNNIFQNLDPATF